MNRLNKTDSGRFLHCRFSLFLKDPFSRLFIYLRPLLHVDNVTKEHILIDVLLL